MEGVGDTFILTTDKKLRSNWSSHSYGITITSHDLDKLRNNFDNFDKKTKVQEPSPPPLLLMMGIFLFRSVDENLNFIDQHGQRDPIIEYFFDQTIIKFSMQ
jgi:hypothetical protein